MDVEALLQLGEQSVHDNMVGTISFSAFEAADLDRVRASPPVLLLLPVTYPFSVHDAFEVPFGKTANHIHFNGLQFSQTARKIQNVFVLTIGLESSTAGQGTLIPCI